MQSLRSTGQNRQVTEYRAIDGNYSRNVVGYCTYHRGYLTEKQMKVHKCYAKHGGICRRLKDMEGRYEAVNHQERIESYLQKILHKLTNIDMNVSRLEKTLKMYREESKCKDGVCNQEDDGK